MSCDILRAISSWLVKNIAIDDCNAIALDLTRTSAKAFKAAVHYSTQQTLPAELCEAQLNVERDIPAYLEKLIIECWIFGHLYHYHAFQNAVMHTFLDLKGRNPKTRSDIDNFPLAFFSLPPGSKMRKLMIEALVLGLRGSPDDTKRPYEWGWLKRFKGVVGFFAEFADAMWDWDNGGEYEGVVRFAPGLNEFESKERYMVSAADDENEEIMVEDDESEFAPE